MTFVYAICVIVFVIFILIVLNSSKKEGITNSSNLEFFRFYNPKCGPCIASEPQWKLFANSHKDIPINEIDTTLQKNYNLVLSHNIKSTPTFLAFKNGVKYEFGKGPRTKERFEKWLNHLQKK